MPDIGPLELVIILVIVLIFVGPKKLPGLGRSLGSGMREFKDSISGKDSGDDETPALTEHREQAAPQAPAVASPADPALLKKDAAAAPVDPAAPPHPGSE